MVATTNCSSTWNIDPAHSVAEFKVKHMMISNVKGQFAKVSGVLDLDESDLTNSHIEATIEAGSLNTRDDQRDTHLKSADFFHVEQHPTLAFKSTRVKRTGDGELAVTGDLTIRGVTRKVEFAVEGPTPPAKDPWGNTRLGLSATTKINHQRLRPDLERALRSWRHPRRRRSDHHAGCSVREGLNRSPQAHIEIMCAARRRNLCRSDQLNKSYKRNRRLKARA